MRNLFTLVFFFFYFVADVQAHQPARFLEEIKGRPNEGAEIVDHFCAICHGDPPQIQVGAPRMHVSDDWKPRLKQGFSTLFKHVNEGIGVMPPRGGCFECSDAQLVLAIKSIVGKNNHVKHFDVKKSA